VTRTTRIAGLAALAALLLPAAAPALDVIDDWRKVGPPDGENPPHAKGQLSPGAAEKLVAAIDVAWRSGRPLHVREDSNSWVIDNLRHAFVPESGLPAPVTMGPPEARLAAGDLLRRIDVLGVRSAGAHLLLVADVHVAFYEPAGGYEPATVGVVFDGQGGVVDLALLAWSFGDGGQADVRSCRIEGTALRVTETRTALGLLAQDGDAEGEYPYEEGTTIDLAVGPAGRFVESQRRPLNLGGQFVDRATNEEIRIEDAGREGLLVIYRARAGIPWKAMKILSVDRRKRAITAKFEKSAVTYTVTLADDGRSLVSAGSDGSKPQRFAWIALSERWRRDGNE
jgi:hypothetical protein